HVEEGSSTHDTSPNSPGRTPVEGRRPRAASKSPLALVAEKSQSNVPRNDTGGVDPPPNHHGSCQSIHEYPWFASITVTYTETRIIPGIDDLFTFRCTFRSPSGTLGHTLITILVN